MLSFEERQKIKDVLQGLNINPNINFPYFLDKIEENGKDIESIKSELRTIIYNQSLIDRKLNSIINLLDR